MSHRHLCSFLCPFTGVFHSFYIHVSFWFLQVMWVCNLCRKQQEILTKSGEWFSGSGVRPGSLGSSFNDPVAGGEAQRDRKLHRSRSQAPPTSTNTTGASPDGTPPTAKGADTMLGSRSQSEPPREK